MADRTEDTRAAITAYLEAMLPDGTGVEHTTLPYYDGDAFYRIESSKGLRQVQIAFTFLEDRDPDEACALLDQWDLAAAIKRISPEECVLVTNDGVAIVPLRTGRPR